MICTHCSQETDKIADIGVFMPGKTNNIQNTQTIARLCMNCVQLLITKQITLDKPEGYIEWQNFLP